MPYIIADDGTNTKNHDKIDRRQHQPEYGNTRKVLVQQVIILGYIPVIEICNPKIEKNIKKESKIEYRKIKPIFAWSSYVLNGAVDAKNPEWLNQKIKKQQKTEISYKFTLHKLVL